MRERKRSPETAEFLDAMAGQHVRTCPVCRRHFILKLQTRPRDSRITTTPPLPNQIRCISCLGLYLEMLGILGVIFSSPNSPRR